MRHKPSATPSVSTSLDMTPLIDIVFQLLIFFVMTFHFAQEEADFRIQTPRRDTPLAANQPTALPTLLLTIRADTNGQAASVALNGEPFASFQAVTQRLFTVLGNDEMGSPAATVEMEIACSPELKYAEAIRALDAVTGIRNPDGTLTRLLENVRFVDLHCVP